VGERKNMRPQTGDTLESTTTADGFDGLGSFIAAQVVADLKYIEPLNKRFDWQTFAASGPGSRRGLNRVARRSQIPGLTESGALSGGLR
jgi:hypothetical protein